MLHLDVEPHHQQHWTVRAPQSTCAKPKLPSTSQSRVQRVVYHSTKLKHDEQIFGKSKQQQLLLRDMVDCVTVHAVLPVEKVKPQLIDIDIFSQLDSWT